MRIPALGSSHLYNSSQSAPCTPKWLNNYIPRKDGVTGKPLESVKITFFNLYFRNTINLGSNHSLLEYQFKENLKALAYNVWCLK